MSSSAGTAFKGAAVKARPVADGGAKGKGIAVPEVKKKVDGSGKLVSVVKQNTVNVVAKPEGKTSTNLSKTVTATKGKDVKGRSAKKVYSLPGQKFDPPEEREPLRIFYESLSKQIPSSEMAEFWMMEHGLLSPDRAKKAYERKQRRQQQLRMGAPIKSPKIEKAESSKRPQISKNGEFKAKKRVNYSDDDDDFSVKKKIKVNVRSRRQGMTLLGKTFNHLTSERGKVIGVAMEARERKM